MGYVIIGRPLGKPATNDEYEECDIPVREGRVENCRMKDIEKRIDFDEQGRQREKFVIHLHERDEKRFYRVMKDEIIGRELWVPAAKDENGTPDIPVREGRIEDYRIQFIEKRIDCDEQGHQREVVVIRLLKRKYICDYGKENNNT